MLPWIEDRSTPYGTRWWCLIGTGSNAIFDIILAIQVRGLREPRTLETLETLTALRAGR